MNGNGSMLGFVVMVYAMKYWWLILLASFSIGFVLAWVIL